MKLISNFIFLIALLFICQQSRSQSSASGYILYGKNKTESSVVCSQQGICKLQKFYDAEYIPIKFTATRLTDSTNEYKITIEFNIDSLRAKQPQQDSFFVNAHGPYIIPDKFSIPSWLITDLGFPSSRNRNLAITAPFSLGIPPPANEEGNVTLTLTNNIILKP